MSTSSAVLVSIMQLIFWLMLLGLCIRYMSWHVVPLLCTLFITMQLYPVGEFLQHTHRGSEWVQQHMSDVGILSGYVVIGNATLLVGLTIKTLVYRKTGQNYRIFNSKILGIFTAISSGLGLGIMMAYELGSQLMHQYAPVENSKYYSGDYDWSDVQAYSLGLIPVMICATWCWQRTARQLKA